MSRLFSGMRRAVAVCPPARSTGMTMQWSAQVLATCSRKSGIITVFASGSMRAVMVPCSGAPAVEAYTYSRTTCRGAWGRTPGGAQPRFGVLMRPQQPSSWAIVRTGRVSSGARVHGCFDGGRTVFFNVSCLAGVVAGCLARGAIFRQPWRYNHREIVVLCTG